MNRLLLIVVLLAMVAWMGCGRSTTLTGSDGSKVTLTKEPEGAEVSVSERTGQSATMGLGKEVALPAGFPPDLAYPGAKVTMGIKDSLSTTAHFKSLDLPQKVADFYQAKLKADGWVFGEFGVVLGPDGGVLQANKEAENRTCRVVVGRSKDGDTGVSETQVNVTVGVIRARPTP